MSDKNNAQEHPLANIFINVLIPVLALSYLSKDPELQQALGKSVRPWHIGVMWDKDPRIPLPVIRHFEKNEQVCIGDNEPYSGRHPHDFTIDFHAEAAGLPHIGFEVRQDLVREKEGARAWAAVLASALRPVLSDKSLYSLLPEQAKFAVSSIPDEAGGATGL